jgi:hypothetical protein
VIVVSLHLSSANIKHLDDACEIYSNYMDLSTCFIKSESYLSF